MSAMGGMRMPGGWSMSMTWMRMPGHTWPEAAAAFIGMWVAMMVAMMLPSLAPMLWRYFQANGGKGKPWVTTLVGVAYFLVWTLLGIAIYPLGLALAAVEMHHPALARVVPSAAGAVVLIAGAMQFTSFKARHLDCCRAAPGRRSILPEDARAAWRHGLGIGLHCCYCCASFTAVLLAIGVMDLRAMALVTVLITVERLAPGGQRVARAVGAVLVGIGVVLIGRATGLA